MSVTVGGEDRLLRLEEIELARGLVSTYVRATDAADLTGMLELYTEDAVLSGSRGEFVGHRGISDYFTMMWGDDPAPKRHFVTNVEVAWLGRGMLEVGAYFLYVARTEASALGWGTYAARVRVEGGAARFSRLELALDQGTDLDAGWSR